MNCQQCQYALSPFDKDCPRCAQMQAGPRAAAVAPAPRVPQHSPAPLALVCVTCGSQAIQKVSGLHQGGVWSAEAIGVGVGYGRISNGQRFTTVSTSHAVSSGATSLAQALAPPLKPHRFQTKAENFCLGGIFVAFIVWMIGGWMLADNPAPIIPMTLYILIASAFTLVPLAAIPSAIRAARENKANTALLVQRWQSVMRHWDQLYYCARCDRVCNPQTGQHAPSRAVSGILYQDILSGTSTL